VTRRGANLEVRIGRIAEALHGRPAPGQFTVVEAIPVNDAEGKLPGLYHVGPPGSTAGLLVFDPAKGEPEVPAGRLAPCGVMIVLGLDRVDMAS